MKLLKALLILLILLAIQGCCPFGTYDGQEGSWQAQQNPRPTRGSSEQLASCVAEDQKVCSDSYSLACADFESGNNKVKPVNQATGEELAGAALERLHRNCKALKTDPNLIKQLCEPRFNQPSCMANNGYKYEYKSVKQCSAMKVM